MVVLTVVLPTETVVLALLKVKADIALDIPESLKTICVLEPAIGPVDPVYPITPCDPVYPITP